MNDFLWGGLFVEKNIKLGILANNIVGESDYLAEHGLSILIQIQDGEKQENYLLGHQKKRFLHYLRLKNF